MAKREIPITSFDGIAENEMPDSMVKTPRLWGSARLCYTICAFLAMVVQLCLRNTLNFVILCMVKPQPTTFENATTFHEELAAAEADSYCGAIDTGTDSSKQRTGDLSWTRNQEFALLGTFYYGYLVTLPIAGRLADRFGGKLLFVHSITVQALVFMTLPFFARRSYEGAVVVRIIQGLIAGCGNPALYQLFSTWAHPTERTAFLSFAYGGFSVGALLVFPISSFLCKLGWETAFYVVGGVSLVFGICCQWLVYSNLEDHPRLSKDEYEYLKCSRVEKTSNKVPWKAILTSVPVYAFIFTHIFNTYGIMVFTLLIPRFFKEAMRLPLDQVGILSSAPFFGAFISKGITIASCSIIEKRENLNLTQFRRIVYVLCNLCTILFITGIVFSDCKQRILVTVFATCIGASADLSFSGAYWPSLLYVAPTYAGLISGIANCLATVSGFLAPLGISAIVRHGTKMEWNSVMSTLIASYLLGAATYGLFGSSKLAKWGKADKSQENNNEPSNENTIEA
uniref:Major facilitator superfamily (MFS) profile domain-containing protein n=1 Tax=Stomoxys calcitrans TaxID=35570 RepID=A0A1I8NQL2_STOCA